MIRLGLTGGIGMGKSTAAELLAKRGAKVCDSDALARELVAPGQPALAEIVEAFGGAVLLGDDSLDRAKVGGLARGDQFSGECIRVAHLRAALGQEFSCRGLAHPDSAREPQSNHRPD
jgi:dephospho-CoA kinase